jgi:Uma2 family endonuclease
MSSVAPRTGHCTFDGFLAIVTRDQKADLLDGVVYMASPESTDDNKLVGWLYRLLSEYCERLDLGEIFFTRVAFRITNKRGPEPDLAYVSKRRLHLIRKGFVDGPPDIAIEIVSSDSVQRDYEDKRRIYERGGVREYWIIDPDMRSATFLRKRQGKFHAVPLDGTRFKSVALKRFQLDVRWLWTKRRPSIDRVIEDLVGH